MKARRSRTARRWVPARSALGLCLALTGLLQAATVSAQAAASDLYPKAVALATFDSAWSRINSTHYDTAFNGVDWGAVREELRPRAARARTLGELRDVLREMLARLGESHYGLIPNEAAGGLEPANGEHGPDQGGDLGLELRLADGRMLVWRVDPDGPAAAAGIRPGWVVRSIGDFRVAPAVESVVALPDAAARRSALTQLLFRINARFNGPVGSRVRVDFEDDADEGQAFILVRRPRPGMHVQFGNLPPFYARLAYERVGEPDCIGVIRFNVWMVPLAQEFDRAVDALRDCRGMVLDLRGNPGGVAGMVMGLAGHFVSEPVALGTMRARGTELNFMANPRRVNTRAETVVPFPGPLAILVDPLSVSTSEIFAGGMQAIGRARIFGENSAGQALPATLLSLPSGDVLMHVVADFTTPGGVRIEGKGVVPDEQVPLSRADLLRGSDTPLQAALRWIRDAAGAKLPTEPAMAAPADGMAVAAERTRMSRHVLYRASILAVASTSLLAARQSAAAQALPDAAAIIRRYVDVMGGEQLRGQPGIRTEGTFTMAAMGTSGPMEVTQARPNQLVLRMTLPGIGEMRSGFDGEIGWSLNPLEGPRLLTGAELTQLKDDADFAATLRAAHLIESMETVDRREVEGQACFRVRIHWKSGRETFDCYAMDTGLLLSTELRTETVMGAVDATVLFSEYRDFDGVQLPTRTVQRVMGQEFVMTVDAVHFGPVDAAVFELPAEIKALVRH